MMQVKLYEFSKRNFYKKASQKNFEKDGILSEKQKKEDLRKKQVVSVGLKRERNLNSNLFEKSVINLEKTKTKEIKEMFKDLTKVQISKTDHVHLAIKISENHVHNLTFTLEAFIKAIKTGHVVYHNFTLTVLSNHVKIYTNDYFRHYRLSLDDWETVKKQFTDALKLHVGK